MVFSNLATALLQLSHITTLYLNDKCLIFEVGSADTIIEDVPGAGFTVQTKAGKTKCATLEEVCTLIGVNMYAAPASVAPAPPATKAAAKPTVIKAKAATTKKAATV